MKRSERLYALSESLRRSGRRGRTAQQLADEFGVSVRTIKRDLMTLETAGLPLRSRPGPGGGYALVASGSLPPVTLSPAQAVSLLSAVAAAPNAPYAYLAAAAVRKIVDVLDPQTRARVELLASRVWVNSRTAGSRRIRSSCEQAMIDQRVLRIDYVSKEGQNTQRDIEPILFANTDGTWYLIGWCRLRGAVRWFSIERIRQASVTQEQCSGHTIEEVGTPPTTATNVSGDWWAN